MLTYACVIIASLIFVGALAFAAIDDARHLRIDNRVPLALLAGFVPLALTGGDAVGHLTAAVIALLAGAVLYRARIWGGGDAKLLPSIVLWVGPLGLERFALITAGAGALLALIMLARAGRSAQVPYGVALAAGGLDWWVSAVLPSLS